MVVDEYGTWMERWRQQFAGLRIEWLRSLVTAHPHPYDEDALLSFAYANGLADQVKQGMMRRMVDMCNSQGLLHPTRSSNNLVQHH
jgi:hypothetical protein